MKRCSMMAWFYWYLYQKIVKVVHYLLLLNTPVNVPRWDRRPWCVWCDAWTACRWPSRSRPDRSPVAWPGWRSWCGRLRRSSHPVVNHNCNLMSSRSRITQNEQVAFINLPAWAWGQWRPRRQSPQPLCATGNDPSTGRHPWWCPRRDQLGIPTVM